jgi:hypothetical protein
MRQAPPILLAAALALTSLACRPGSGDRAPEPAPSASSAGTGSAAPAASSASAARGPLPWSRAFPGVKITAMAPGPDDGVIVVGGVTGTVDLGAGPVGGKGVSNAFVASYDRTGKHVWSKRFPGDGAQVATGVAVGPGGTVVVTGTLDREADFGGGSLKSAGMIDVFVVALDAAGQHLWSKRFGDDEEQEAGAVAVGPDGSVYLAGSFEGSIDLGGGRLVSAGGDDVFVAKLDPRGNHVWSKRSGDRQAQHGRALAVDPGGNLVLAGDAQGALDFAGAPGSPDASSLFLVCFDPAGRVLAGKRFPAERRAVVRPHAVAVDRRGDVYVAGGLRGTIDLGSGPIQSASEGELDAFVLKTSGMAPGGPGGAPAVPWGQPIFAKRFGDAASQEARALALDSDGGVWLAGRFVGTIDLGGGPLPSAGKEDIFLAHLDASASHLSSKRFGDADRQEATALVVDRAGHPTLAGEVRGTVDFGAGPLTGSAAFLAKLP